MTKAFMNQDLGTPETRNAWFSPLQGTLPPEWGNQFVNLEVVDLGVADKSLTYAVTANNDSLQGTIPSTWANMSSLWLMNLHQQVGLCAWSDDDAPIDVHFAAANGNLEWALNFTANLDWRALTEVDSAYYDDSNRTWWGQKSALLDGWNPYSHGPHKDSLNRSVLNLFSAYNTTRTPFRCQQPKKSPFTRLADEMMLWPLYTEENCVKYGNEEYAVFDTCTDYIARDPDNPQYLEKRMPQTKKDWSQDCSPKWLKDLHENHPYVANTYDYRLNQASNDIWNDFEVSAPAAAVRFGY